MAYLIDPAKEAISKNFGQSGHDSNCTSYCCVIIGPGGKTTNIENNEKGILDAYPLRLAQGIRGESLPSDHDGYAEGIYKTHHFDSTAGMSD